MSLGWLWETLVYQLQVVVHRLLKLKTLFLLNVHLFLTYKFGMNVHEYMLDMINCRHVKLGLMIGMIL